MTPAYLTESKPRYTATLLLQTGNVLCIRNGILYLTLLSTYRIDHMTNGRKLHNIKHRTSKQHNTGNNCSGKEDELMSRTLETNGLAEKFNWNAHHKLPLNK